MSLKILAVDLSCIFTRNWMATQGKDYSEAFNRTIQAIGRYREGYDRVAVCCDSGVSWRRFAWDSYKADRPNRGEAYREQVRRTIDRLGDDGCSIFRGPRINVVDAPADAEYFAEADDVIGTLCAWALEGGHEVTILSSDKDLLQCVGGPIRYMKLEEGTIMGPEEVKQHFGVEPSRIADLLAIGGDTSDNYKPYPGIGAGTAAKLINKFGSAAAVFERENWDQLEGFLGKSYADKIKLVGREPCERALRVATVLRDLELDFDRLLEPPVYRKPEPVIKVDFRPAQQQAQESVAAAAQQKAEAADQPGGPLPAANAAAVSAEAKPSAAPPIVKRATAVSTERYQLNPFALEPSDSLQAWNLAIAVCGSTLFRKFPNPEAALMVILEGRALGLPSIVALKNAHVVKGNVGWSARLIRGLVMKTPLCDYFRIVESTMERAVAVCRRVGDPEFRVESTPELAKLRGFIKEPGANRPGYAVEENWWQTDPLSMLVADVERRGARIGWPDVVAGLYTPDELQLGVTAEGVQIIEAQAA